LISNRNKIESQQMSKLTSISACFYLTRFDIWAAGRGIS
jgi:hypothetical protein